MSSSVFNRSVYTTSDQYITNFPDTVYNFYPHDHLTSLMNTLLGDTGVGQLLLAQNTASLTQNLNGMEFSDLDNIVGSLLGSPRLSTEQYGIQVNPFQDQLLRNNWDSIHMADSAYRERLTLMLTAINSGPTVLGLTLLCEAILGQKVRIIETWRAPFSGGEFIYPQAGKTPIINTYNSTNKTGQYGPLYSTMFNTDSITEFLIVAKGDTNYTQDVVQNVINSVNLLKPENSIATFYIPDPSYPIFNYAAGTTILSFAPGQGPAPSDIYCNVDVMYNGNSILNTYINNINTLATSFGATEQVTLNAAIPSGTTNNLNLTLQVNTSLFDIPIYCKQMIADSEWYEFDMIAAVNSAILSSNISELSQYSNRYWLSSNNMATGPLFAHHETAEETLDLVSLVSNVQLVTYPSLSSAPPTPAPTPTPPTPPTKPAPNSTSSVYAQYDFAINQKIVSANGRYFAIMQSDGNFVVYDQDPQYYYSVPSNTYLSYSGNDIYGYGSSGSAVVQIQQNLNQLTNAGLVVDGLYGVLTRAAVENFQRFWTLTVDGICGPDTWGVVLWELYATSPHNVAIWATNTAGSGATYARLQTDGNFVVYNDSHNPKFSSKSSGKYPVMIMQNDGNLVIYETSGPNKWQTFGFPNAIWSWWTGELDPSISGYNAFIKSISPPPPPPPPAPPKIVYGDWINIGLADSPDNYPNGKYPGDPNHYNRTNIIYTGSSTTLSNLSILTLSNVSFLKNITVSTPGQGSVIDANGVPHTFTFTGVDQSSSSLTSCSFTGDVTQTLLANANVTIISYNFEYPNQQSYLNYIKSMVNKLQGKLDNSTTPTKYCLPISNAYWNTQVPSGSIPLISILAPPKVKINSTVYGAI